MTKTATRLYSSLGPTQFQTSLMEHYERKNKETKRTRRAALHEKFSRKLKKYSVTSLHWDLKDLGSRGHHTVACKHEITRKWRKLVDFTEIPTVKFWNKTLPNSSLCVAPCLPINRCTRTAAYASHRSLGDRALAQRISTNCRPLIKSLSLKCPTNETIQQSVVHSKPLLFWSN